MSIKSNDKGVLIFGFSNDQIDYFRQAIWCADRVNQYLGLPCTIITDKTPSQNSSHHIVIANAESGGSRVYSIQSQVVTKAWYNASRYAAWDLSPYDQTVVLDSDYVVCSDQLLDLFDSNQSILAIKHVYDITNRGGFAPYERISVHRGLHHYWATVLYFDRSQISKDFFSVMGMIQKNYDHYANLYEFPSHPFRNDFAVSIALNTIYGHVPDAIPEIPWHMANVFADVGVKIHAKDTFEFTYRQGSQGAWQRMLLSRQDFHCMNKIDLEKIYATTS